MIQANEARRNNWVLFDDRYFKIDVISKEAPTLDTTEFGIGVVSWNNIHPIPLTEEILLKCGFVPCSITDNHFNISGMRIWKCNDMFLCDKNGVNIKCLHSLQNLYFALTGQELEVKLS